MSTDIIMSTIGQFLLVLAAYILGTMHNKFFRRCNDVQRDPKDRRRKKKII